MSRIRISNWFTYPSISTPTSTHAKDEEDIILIGTMESSWTKKVSRWLNISPAVTLENISVEEYAAANARTQDLDYKSRRVPIKTVELAV